MGFLASQLVLLNRQEFDSLPYVCRCIVAAPTGRGVFDGNVRVNRLAQRTDAGQLSRNLLLVPRGNMQNSMHYQPVLQGRRGICFEGPAFCCHWGLV